MKTGQHEQPLVVRYLSVIEGLGLGSGRDLILGGPFIAADLIAGAKEQMSLLATANIVQSLCRRKSSEWLDREILKPGEKV